uniref:Uncharacterized protein slr0014 n=1 Tax=Zeugodacus cucurbitae TaxID=28588 RepID=A0A0A1X9Z1_ZEUCU
MTTISVSSTESTAEETECLLGDGTKTWGNTNMDTTQSKTSQKADIIRSLGNHKINKQTESQSCAGQQLLKTAVTSCWQKSMQRLTNTNKAGSPPANYCNWSYRMLRRKQLLLLLALLIFIVYLSSSMSNNDYADERIPVLHYSHVPGMKGYLVWSESCRIPDVDVHAPDMMQHFKREKYKPCSNKKPLTTVVYNATSREYVLQIEESEIKSFSKSGRIHCCYQSIMRNGTGIKADVDYNRLVNVWTQFSTLLRRYIG